MRTSHLSADDHTHAFSRMAKNIGWLAGSRGFIGVLSIAYLATAARALGPRGFGEFVLVLTYAQMITNLVQFQSWKGVIRFGALHLAKGRQGRLARLFGFTATLDTLSAVIGGFIAVIGVRLAGPLLHWSPDTPTPAALFGVVILLASGGTPSGMLRLFDRFDLQAYSEAIGPVVRFVGAITAWLLGGGILAFLVVWGLAALSQTIVQWIAALAINGARLTFGRRSFARALKENRRLWRFMLQTNISNSLSLFWMQLGTLAVGAVAGPVQAGGFRIAQRVVKGIAKPVETITRALYPELARLIAEDNHTVVRKVLIRASGLAAGLAIFLVLIAGLAGSQILHVIAGKQFEFAHVYLFLLSIAASIDLAGFALEPFLSAHGRPGRVLRSRVFGALCYAVLIGSLLPTIGPNGAAIASIGASLVIFVQLAHSAVRVMGRHGPQSTKRNIGAPSYQQAFQPDRRRRAMKVWALLGAHHGDNNQVLALAEGLGLQFERKYLNYNRWRHLGPHLLGSTFLSLTRESRRAAIGPLPDLTISTGHRSVPVVRALRKRSGGKLRTIHIGYPRISPSHFDLVVATPEFPIADHQNLLRIPYALTRPPIRETAGDSFWSAHPPPRTLLIIGGPALYWRLDRTEISSALAHALKHAAIQGGSVLVVGSPRTPDALLKQVQGQLDDASVPATLVPTRGPPAYRALLAHADEIVVTAESVAMVSEAIATGRPVSLVTVRPTLLGRILMTVTDMVVPGRRIPPRDLRFFWELLQENRLVGLGCNCRRRPLPDPADLVAARVNTILAADAVVPTREHSL